MPFDLRNAKGMTLIEVTAALVLVAVMLMALAAIVAQTAVFSKRVDLLYRSSYLAQRRIDTLKRLDFSQLPLSAENAVSVDVDGTLKSDGDYARTTEVTVNFDNNPYLTKVKVTVSRVDISMTTGQKGDLASQPVIMETLIADVD